MYVWYFIKEGFIVLLVAFGKWMEIFWHTKYCKGYIVWRIMFILKFRLFSSRKSLSLAEVKLFYSSFQTIKTWNGLKKMLQSYCNEVNMWYGNFLKRLRWNHPMMLVLLHTRTHARTHANTHTHTHTHTHTRSHTKRDRYTYTNIDIDIYTHIHLLKDICW